MKCPEIVQVAHDEHAQVHKGQNSRKSPQDKLWAKMAESRVVAVRRAESLEIRLIFGIFLVKSAADISSYLAMVFLRLLLAN